MGLPSLAKRSDAVGLLCRPNGSARRIANERFRTVAGRSFAFERADHAALRRRVEHLCVLSELCVDRSLRAINVRAARAQMVRYPEIPNIAVASAPSTNEMTMITTADTSM